MSDFTHFYANIPDRGWVLFPRAWQAAARATGARLYAAGPEAPPVTEPTEIDAPPEGVLTEGEGRELQKGALSSPSSEPSPQEFARGAGESPDVLEAAREAAARARALPPPESSPRFGKFIAPNFAVQPGAFSRCSSCRTPYTPSLRGDTGRCSNCAHAARLGGGG